MTAHAEIAASPYQFISQPGWVKFLRDTWTIMEMKALFMIGGWYWFVARPFVFPIGVLFWLSVMLPSDPEVNIRILAGSIVFGVSLSTGNMLSTQILQDRFLGRLKLLITMPMSKGSYGIGVLAFSAVQTIPIIVVLLAFAPIVDVDLDLTWVFFPLILASLLSISGMAILIGSYAPSLETGGIMSNLFGIVLVMVSPVFFTMDQAPLVLKIVGWVSPMRYAADGINQSISGNTDVWLELAVLAGFAIVSMGLGIWKLAWRQR
jgi:ABC-type multidrug transport system permease subunit